LKKWLFDTTKEVEVSESDNFANDLFFWQVSGDRSARDCLFSLSFRSPWGCFYFQAIEDVNKGQIMAGEKLYELKALQDVSRKIEVIKSGRD